MFADGQKDHRKGRGGVDCYSVLMPDGELQEVTGGIGSLSEGDIRALPPELRWRKVAEAALARSVQYVNDSTYAPSREKHRAQCSRLSRLLGVPDPWMQRLADALGLIDHPVESKSKANVSMEAFGI